MSDDSMRIAAQWKLARVAALMTATALAACGGGGGGGGQPPPPPAPPPAAAELKITGSDDAAVADDATISIHAEASGSTGVPTWTLEGPGALSAASGVDVEYLPPDSEELTEPAGAKVTASYGGLQSHFEIALTPKVVPGHNWTTVTARARTFQHVAYGEGRYVASDQDGLWHSTDGKAWREVTYGDQDNPNMRGHFSDVAWNGGVWAALFVDSAASSIFAATSADGQQWTLQPQALPWSLDRLVAGNGRFIAGRYDAQVSTDGVHWTSTGKSFSDLAFGNGMFMGVIDRDVPYRSTDGLTWTPLTDPPSYFGELAFAGGQFLGVNSTDHTQSSDGVLWVNSTETFDVQRLLGAGERFFASTDAGFLSRRPGDFWAAAPSMPFPQQPADIASGPGGYLGVSPFGWVSTSSDGSTWSPQVRGSYGDMKAVIDFGGTYVTVSDLGWALRSADGQSWSASLMLPAAGTLRAGPVALAQGGGVLVATGCVHASDGCNGDPGMWMRSTDAVNWAAASTPAPANLVVGVVYDGKRFVAIDAPGNVYASTDGDHWTTIGSVPGAQYLDGITFGGGLYVAYGRSGLIATSANGVSWTTSPGVSDVDDTGGPVLRSLTDVVWDGHQFVGVGVYVRATSPDGHTWTKGPSGVSLGALASCEGVIVGVVGDSAESSRDGRKWYVRRQWATGAAMDAVACGHGRFVAVGRDGSISVSDH